MKNFSLKMSLRLCTLLMMIVCSSLWLSSCSDESEPKDTTAPEVSFTNLTVDKEIWNTITINLDANDNQGIATLEIFIDGSNLIKTITEAPFEVSWDSNTVPDGSHTVKVVVTDKSGNTVEKEVTILVKNVLVSIDFAADQLLSEAGYIERGFVFLSDEAGKVIASAEYTNGQHLELKSSAFNGDKFYLTEVLLENDIVYGDFVRLWTFADIERGKWVVIDDRDDDDETYAGEATLNFSNAASLASYTAYSNGDEAYADESSPSSIIRVRKSPGKLYVVRNNEGGSPAPTYQLYSNIVVGANSINLSSVNQALTKVTATIPAGSYASVEVKAYPVANDYTERYSIGYFGSDANFDIFYPGSAFPSYYIENFYETDNVYYSRGSRTEFGNFSSLTHTEGFSFANSKLTYSASGNYDLVTAGFYNVDETAYWTLVLPLGSAISIPTIELPSSLNSLNIPSMGLPNFYSIHDYENISNYTDLKTFIRNSTSSAAELAADGKNYVIMDFYSVPSGGRVKQRGSHFGLGTETWEKSK